MDGSTQRSAPYVGSRVRKQDGERFLTGRATYVDDVRFVDLTHLSIVRSPHAHARIRRIGLERVRADPRCLLAIEGAEAAELTDPVPHFFSAGLFGGQHADVRALARGKAVYHGQPVAAVVAATKHDADDLRALVEIEWEELPVVVGLDAALAADAPRVYDDWCDNVVIHLSFPFGDYAAAAAAADRVVADEFQIQRYSSQPMEPRGYVADWDPRARRLTYHGSAQNPHPFRWVLSRALRLEEEQVRIIAPSVGGGFGLKMHGHPEEPLVALASMLLGRPVKWIETREETLTIGAREHVHRFEIAFSDDGVISGFKDHFITNVGAISAVPGWGMSMVTALTFPSGYEVPNTEVDLTVVATNKGPWSPTRGYGKEAANLVTERAVDLVALELGMDRAEVRRRNLLRSSQMPYRMNSGLNIDSGDYPAGLEDALALLDYDGFERRRAAAAGDGRHLGFGIAFELTPEAADIPNSLASGFDSCTVRMSPSGRVSLLAGVTTPGGGNDTALAQIVADELGVSIDTITVTQGDTDICPYGFGNSAGRSTVVGSGAAVLAARDVRAKLVAAAAIKLEADAAAIDLREDHAIAAPTGRRIPIRDLAYEVYASAFGSMSGVEPPLEATRSYKPENIDSIPDELGRIQPYPTYSYAVHVTEVEVDVQTGKTSVLRFGVLHDCGTIINPTFVEGQMHGAVAMGIGAALSEEQRYGADGHLLSDRLKTYLMPRAGDLPAIEIAHRVTPSPYTSLGVKGAGEAGVGGAQAAVVNAINDAIAPFGARVRQTPADAPTVLAAIRAGTRTREPVNAPA